MRASLGNRLDHGRTFHALEALQLFFQQLCTAHGQRDFDHFRILSRGGIRLHQKHKPPYWTAA
ncbi:hypothetical protein [Chromobacterium sp. Beijing]|uniref:hypothetical protein n=1 Tax=Chromobacterium sp. Beijing TaxID=2735795 RepID=UPI001F3536E5|nr:hypothetical protein [Chromobacterium sp. Beijing]